MENKEDQHLDAPGEPSSTPVLFKDMPKSAEPVPKVLIDMYDNGAKFVRVPKSLKTDEVIEEGRTSGEAQKGVSCLLLG